MKLKENADCKDILPKISIKDARLKLGKTGKSMTDSEIEKLRNGLYSLINQILDNHTL